ncbi:MAG: hypothetical protein U1A77_11125 [Pirellulales bacterium]
MLTPPESTGPKRKQSRLYLARAQLSLVEHSLCPLDTATSLQPGLQHRVSYSYTDKNHHTKQASVTVFGPQGLSPADELTLWGLLSLTLSRPEPQAEFMATPHYCLRMLGVIQDNDHKGGKQYQLFRDTIRRLARVVYENTAFYDPVRGEHRDVAFGLLKYSLPVDATSSRAWRFYWDQQFFEFCLAAKSTLRFDLDMYRQLDFASRRLFLLLQKVFWRNEHSPPFDLRTLAVSTLGFASHLETKNLMQKVMHCTQVLLDHQILALPAGIETPKGLVTKLAPGNYLVRFHRGNYFEKPFHTKKAATPPDSPLLDPLRAIGFDEAAIIRILSQYPERILSEWADITLAARERNGEEFFSKSAAAYFLDNVKAAHAGTRTSPDWWRELRHQEERERQSQYRESREHTTRQSEEAAFNAYLAADARDAFERVMQRLFADLQTQGMNESQARESAEHIARTNLRARFRQEHPEFRNASSF